MQIEDICTLTKATFHLLAVKQYYSIRYHYNRNLNYGKCKMSKSYALNISRRAYSPTR